MISKDALRKRIKELEGQNKVLEFQLSAFKQVAIFYSSLRDKHDGGDLARKVIHDVKLRVKSKRYKPINYLIAQIIKETDESFPIYIEGLYQDHEE